MKSRLIVVAFSIVIFGGLAVGQQPAPQQPVAGPAKISALIITGQNGHNWRATTPVLRQILEDTGRFEVRVAEEFRGASAETLAPYDLVIVHYYERGRPELRWGEKTDQALADFVRSGKGLVIYHFAVAAFDGWADYEKMAAGMWAPPKGYGHHSARHDFVVDIKDSEHPITKGLKASFPQANDELYANLRWQPEGSYHVLATAWDDHELYKASRTDAKAPQPMSGPGVHEPVMWTVDFGKGRVFTTVLGHDVPNVQTAAFTTTFTRGAEWAATGKVTLAVPAELAR